MSGRDEWMGDALCVCFPSFPWTVDGHRVDAVDTDLMTRVCRLCPVLARCGLFVETEQITAGFWAGEHHIQSKESGSKEAA